VSDRRPPQPQPRPRWRTDVSAGIAGGYAGTAAVGDLVIADIVIAADLGAEDDDGRLIGLSDLGFGPSRLPVDPDALDRAVATMAGAGRAAVVGPVLTVSTASGTAATARARQHRFGAAAEAMEGFGVAAAVAMQRGALPVDSAGSAGSADPAFLEVRAVSNPAGVRDRAAWDIRGALAVLGRGCAVVLSATMAR